MNRDDLAALQRLELRTRRLRLAVVNPATSGALVAAATTGAFADADPNTFGLHRLPAAQRGAATLDLHRKCATWWTPQLWRLELCVSLEDTVIGVQGISAKSFGEHRNVTSGSWLIHTHQNRGYGTEMRAAVLELAAALGARTATSDTLIENAASNAVSARLSYQRNGIRIQCVNGEARVAQRYVLELDTRRTPRADTRISGLDDTRHLFGV